MSISEAIEKLNEVLGKYTYFSVKCEYNRHSHDRTTLVFSVYSEKVGHHTASSLEKAYDSWEKAYLDIVNAEFVEQAEALVEEVEEENAN